MVLQVDVLCVCLCAGSKSVDVVKMLLSAHVDVNHKNMLGMNALLLVAGYGNDHLVRLIVQSAADPYSTNDFGHTALHLAIVGKRSQVCPRFYILSGAVLSKRWAGGIANPPDQSTPPKKNVLLNVNGFWASG